MLIINLLCNSLWGSYLFASGFLDPAMKIDLIRSSSISPLLYILYFFYTFGNLITPIIIKTFQYLYYDLCYLLIFAVISDRIEHLALHVLSSFSMLLTFADMEELYYAFLFMRVASFLSFSLVIFSLLNVYTFYQKARFPYCRFFQTWLIPSMPVFCIFLSSHFFMAWWYLFLIHYFRVIYLSLGREIHLIFSPCLSFFGMNFPLPTISVSLQVIHSFIFVRYFPGIFVWKLSRIAFSELYLVSLLFIVLTLEGLWLWGEYPASQHSYAWECETEFLNCLFSFRCFLPVIRDVSNQR